MRQYDNAYSTDKRIIEFKRFNIKRNLLTVRTVCGIRPFNEGGNLHLTRFGLNKSHRLKSILFNSNTIDVSSYAIISSKWYNQPIMSYSCSILPKITLELSSSWNLQQNMNQLQSLEIRYIIASIQSVSEWCNTSSFMI